MDKDVLPRIHANKSESLAVIKPFDSAFALHTALLSPYPTLGTETWQNYLWPGNTRYGFGNEYLPENLACDPAAVSIYHSPSRVSRGWQGDLHCTLSLSITMPRGPQYLVRTIDRYILQELGMPFAQSLGALTFILLTREILRLVELLINKGVGLVPLLKTFILLLPSFFVLTLPMACLIASISAFSRLSSDRELTAMQATGVSIGRLLRPVLLFSTAVFLVTLYLAQFAQPWTGQSLKKLALIMLRDQVSLAFDEGVFNTPTEKVVMYVGERSLPGGPHGVFISDTRIKEEPRIIVARDWSVINDP